MQARIGAMWRSRPSPASTRRALRQTVTVVLILLAGSATAGEARENRGWRVRFELVSVEPSAELSASILGFSLGAEIDGAIGLGLAAEYRFSRWAGIELDLATSSHDIVLSADSPFGQISFAADDSLRASSFTLGLTFHLTPGRPVDVFLGPLIGGIVYSPVDLGVIEGITVETDYAGETALGAQVGVAVRLGGGPWFAHGGVRWLDTDYELDIDEAIEIGFDPTEIFFGVGAGF